MVTTKTCEDTIMPRGLWLFAALVPICLVDLGCSQAKDDLPRVAIHGTVIYKETAPAKAALLLTPGPNTKGPATSAVVQDGHFHLSKSTGPVPGEYVVELVEPAPVRQGGAIDEKKAGPPMSAQEKKARAKAVVEKMRKPLVQVTIPQKGGKLELKFQ